jgi:hypothetical protein
LDHGSQPFYCIDSQHFVCHRLNPCMNSCSGRLTVNRKQYYPSAQPNYHTPRDSSDAATLDCATVERCTVYRHSSGWCDTCHTLIATDMGNARDALGGLWLDASRLHRKLIIIVLQRST